jgi:hypothetical protein
LLHGVKIVDCRGGAAGPRRSVQVASTAARWIKKINRARSARLHFHRVGSALRADKRESTAQTRVADLG